MRDGKMACYPQNVMTTQLTDVVIRSLKRHPERRHYGGTYLVASALAEAFPCKGNG